MASSLRPSALLVLSISALLAVYLGLVLTRWNPARQPDRVVLELGGAAIRAREIDGPLAELRVAFPSYGDDTLRWHLLDFGVGPAALLHARLPEASAAARREALAWADRLREGADFAELAVEQRGGATDELPLGLVSQPNPATLGAQVAAAVARLEPGEWSGPLKTPLGWEIVYLHQRFGERRARANVQLMRLTFPVGNEADLARALQDWRALPFWAEAEYLRAFPSEVRRARSRPTKPRP